MTVYVCYHRDRLLSTQISLYVSVDKFVVVLIEDVLIYYKLRGRTGRVFENLVASVERKGGFMLSYQGEKIGGKG